MVNITDESRNPNLNVNSKWCQESTIKSTNFKAKKIFFETYMKRGDNFEITVGQSASTDSMTSLIVIAKEPIAANGRADYILHKESSQWESSLQKLTKAGSGAESETRV